MQYTYNTAGLPETVQQKESGGSFADIVSDFDYGPHGQVTYKLFGNGVESPYTFDAAEFYRLANILTTVPASEGFSGGGGGGMGFAEDPFRSFALGIHRHPLAIAMLDVPAAPEDAQLSDTVPSAYLPARERPKKRQPALTGTPLRLGGRCLPIGRRCDPERPPLRKALRRLRQSLRMMPNNRFPRSLDGSGGRGGARRRGALRNPGVNRLDA